MAFLNSVLCSCINFILKRHALTWGKAASKLKNIPHPALNVGRQERWTGISRAPVVSLALREAEELATSLTSSKKHFQIQKDFYATWQVKFYSS